MDLFDKLGTDISIEILTCLEDPGDLVRASAVSKTWRNLVIDNSLCKNMCLRMFRQLSKVHSVADLTSGIEEQNGHASSGSQELILQTENKAYGFLARGATSFPIKSLILDALSASSTDNFPDEDILNTLEPRDRIDDLPSYWSSKGQSDPAVPEKILYRLEGNLCVVTEISIQPFKAYFQRDYPIYSAKAVRFRMGHSAFSGRFWRLTSPQKIVWTYTSQEFPMAQENRLQKFKLPEPVLCIGGFLQIELLGRVQKQEIDDQYYICISHVKAVGRSFSGVFDVDIPAPKNSGTFVLNVLSYTPPLSVEAVEKPTLCPGRNLRHPIEFLRHGMIRHMVRELPEDDEDSDDNYLNEWA